MPFDSGGQTWQSLSGFQAAQPSILRILFALASRSIPEHRDENSSRSGVNPLTLLLSTYSLPWYFSASLIHDVCARNASPSKSLLQSTQVSTQQARQDKQCLSTCAESGIDKRQPQHEGSNNKEATKVYAITPKWKPTAPNLRLANGFLTGTTHKRDHAAFYSHSRAESKTLRS
jgi:hypothetical protein